MRVISNRYELREELGSGGMATVWLGWDARLHRRVAVKLLANVLAADKAFVARFEREARLAAGLSHPNIVAVFDYGTDGETPYIVMEAVEGESLGSRLRREGRLDETEVRRLGESVLAAMQVAHNHGIIHRDIKPSNILMGSNGSIKVADFGIARLTSDATQLTDTGVMLGTVAYLSPEQCAGASANERSDIYGFGCVAYECLTGRPPFVGETPASVMYQHQHVEPRPIVELRPEISGHMQASIMRALMKSPSDRFSSADVMGLALADTASASTEPLAEITHAPTEVLPKSTTDGKPVVTWRLVAFVAVVIAVLGGTAAGIAYVATQSGKPQKTATGATHNGATSTSSTQAVTGAPTTSSTNGTTTTSSGGPLAHPSAGQWVAVMASIPQGQGLSAAEQKLSGIAQTVSDAQLLDSDEYSSLRPGYYVVFEGAYSSSKAALAECAAVGRSVPASCYSRYLTATTTQPTAPPTSPGSGQWTSTHLTITTQSLGAVRIGMTLDQAQAAAGMTFDGMGDGMYYPTNSANHIYVGLGSNVVCVGATLGSYTNSYTVSTPEGFQLGDSVQRLLAVYGNRANYLPAPAGGGIDPNPGYIVAENGGNLFFYFDANANVFQIAGGPGVTDSNSCPG